jgi:hypothetical protein
MQVSWNHIEHSACLFQSGIVYKRPCFLDWLNILKIAHYWIDLLCISPIPHICLEVTRSRYHDFDKMCFQLTDFAVIH